MGACSDDDPKAEQDLDDKKVLTHAGVTDVILNADKFPNFAHTCWKGTHGQIGFWSTTDRVTLIIYNDHACPGSQIELPMTVISGDPADVAGGNGG